MKISGRRLNQNTGAGAFYRGVKKTLKNTINRLRRSDEKRRTRQATLEYNRTKD